MPEEMITALARQTAEMTSRMTIDQLEQRGAFDAHLESPAPAAPQPPPDSPQRPQPPQPGSDEPAQGPAPPQRQTFADRFMGR
jgi:hypothetical protein